MFMLCPICAGEFDPRDNECPSCGCRLVPSAVTKESAGVATVDREPVAFVELCRPSSYPIAVLIKETLEQNGVAALVQGGHALSVLPHLAFGGELRVLVDESQIEFARQLYQSYFESDDDIDYIQED
jgi:putative signal transducing protein